MKKSVVILIAIIYVTSIALVSFFGRAYKVFNEVIDVQSIESLNEELIAQHMHPKYPGQWEPTDEWNKEWANDREWS